MVCPLESVIESRCSRVTMILRFKGACAFSFSSAATSRLAVAASAIDQHACTASPSLDT